ncbi:hypothetical protein [uncultured Pseudoflavonifractor sp.]|uniref:hypothetical protein n=1 Tax=uncultured Pseudoflavonifractor sp. TaxID=1221379 RepID=UPI0025F89168|nr:hypothetical protein [uncultured Pseudoflavonifractor sp.]
MYRKQRLYRKYALARYGALCACCALLLLAFARTIGYHQLLLLPFCLVVVLAVPYFSAVYTYEYDGSRLVVSQGSGENPPVLEIIDAEDILAYGVYLPGQLSARRASRTVRAYLFLDPRSKRYLLYRLPGGGTGILIFSPDQEMRQALIREQWIFQVS